MVHYLGLSCERRPVRVPGTGGRENLSTLFLLAGTAGGSETGWEVEAEAVLSLVVSVCNIHTYMIANMTFTVIFFYDRHETIVWDDVFFLTFTCKTAVACTSSPQTHFILSIYLPTTFGTVICFSSKKRYWYLNKWGLQLHTWSSINHIDPTAEVSTKSKTRLLQTCTPLWYSYENVSRA